MPKTTQPKHSERAFVFPSDLGWMVLVTDGTQIQRLTFGFSSQGTARQRFARNRGWVWPAPSRSENSWIRAIQEYAAGRPIDLSQLPVDESHMTAFQKRVRDRCKQLKRGQMLTYGQLAEWAGFPGAARAVGSVMSRNQTPLIMPCHRVVGAANLGGFSTPQGLEMKRRLLRLEGVSFSRRAGTKC